jgi:transcriptional regulator with XRE-family HTH domain
MAEIWTLRIKALFENSGMTLRDVSRMTDIPKSAVQRYISGETEKIPLDRIKALAKAFGVTSEFVMGLDDDKREFTDKEKELLKVFNEVPEGYKDFVLGTIESAVKNLKRS